MLASRDGKIVFENSLDARLDVVFRKKLPEVFPIIDCRYVLVCSINAYRQLYLYSLCCWISSQSIHGF